MLKNALVFLSITTAFLTGCATMRAQHCTENAGYEKGMNDVKMGRLMSMSSIAVFCSGEDIEIAQKGYRAGYEAGKSSQGGPSLSLTFQDGKLGLAGSYSCQLRYGNQTFSDEGMTEASARNGAFTKCRQQIPSCSESEITCTKR